jgi:Leucine-rich repeat (LRR) protein
LDKEYPKEQRKNVTELNINSKELEGSLVMSGFNNLKKLDCSRNNLTILNIVDSTNSLEELVANDNQLSQLTWEFDAPTNVKVLNLANNNWHNNDGFWNLSFSFPKLQFLDVKSSGIKKENMGNIGHIGEIHQDTFTRNVYCDQCEKNIGDDKLA